jgi:hypothetical protein
VPSVFVLSWIHEGGDVSEVSFSVKAEDGRELLRLRRPCLDRLKADAWRRRRGSKSMATSAQVSAFFTCDEDVFAESNLHWNAYQKNLENAPPGTVSPPVALFLAEDAASVEIALVKGTRGEDNVVTVDLLKTRQFLYASEGDYEAFEALAAPARPGSKDDASILKLFLARKIADVPRPTSDDETPLCIDGRHLRQWFAENDDRIVWDAARKVWTTPDGAPAMQDTPDE